MTFDPNDFRLTAYVLDELDAKERAAVDELLARDESAREFVAGLRDTTKLLSTELATDPTPATLTDDQHAALDKAALGADSSRMSSLRMATWLTCGALAAAAVFMMIAFAAKSDNDSDAASHTEMAEQRQVATADTWRPRRPMALDNNAAMMPSPNSAANANSETTSQDPTAPARPRANYAMSPSAKDSVALLTRNQPNRDRYAAQASNPFADVTIKPLSTFSIDVDTAAYSAVRSYLARGIRPPKGSVRIEEFINYFAYDYPLPRGKHPFSVTTEVSVAPWNQANKLVRIGLRGRGVEAAKDTPSNLVFLLDVSGSMNHPSKLPLLRRAMKMLVRNLKPTDRVAIVVYAGASGVVLPSTAVRNQRAIDTALTRLSAGGSTNGGAGIALAYKIAQANFVKGGVNRVILATDGDFNVGANSDAALVSLIKSKAKSNVFLTVLGFGRGNYNDSMLEKLTGHGNGNYAYIDTISEARKVFVEQLSSTLVTIAKDVKIQIEFNPKHVAKYRLIGYENRRLAARDFNDDKKDAGEIGANHRVTALYELVPHTSHSAGHSRSNVDRLKYQARTTRTKHGDELFTIKLRYKQPEGERSALMSFAVKNKAVELAATSRDFKLAAAVAEYGMLLRNSPHKGQASYEHALKLATQAAVRDPYGYRKELIGLIRRAKALPR